MPKVELNLEDDELKGKHPITDRQKLIEPSPQILR